MKYYVKDLEEKSNPYPCTNCSHGSGSYSNGEDKNGKYIESKSCRDDGKCSEYKEYNERKALNQNILL